MLKQIIYPANNKLEKQNNICMCNYQTLWILTNFVLDFL